MFGEDEVRFEGNVGWKRYVLTRWPKTPSWPPKAQFKKVPDALARRIILDASRDTYGNPNWRLLHFLGIREHPYNLNTSDLERLVDTRLAGAPRPVLHEQLEEPMSRPRPAPMGRPAAEYVPDHRLDFLEIEVVADDGGAITGAHFELYLADGEGRIVVTDGRGMVRVDRIPRGNCSLRLHNLTRDP